MNRKKKKLIKTIAGLVVVGLLILILCFMFKDSYKDIFNQLAHTDIGIFIGIVVLGNFYYIIDAFVFRFLFKKEGYNLSFTRCTALAYMSIFFNVTTFGAGIKPGQVLYLHRKGIDPGKGFGIATMPYIFHKTVIVVYAVAMLIFNNSFVVRNFSSTFGYMYAGVILSVLIIVFLILMCSASWFHKLVFKFLDLVFSRGKLKSFNEIMKTQINLLREGTTKIIRNPKAWLALTGINIVKMSCWYIIPTIAIFAAGGSLGGVTINQALTVTALMQLLMGVIPTSGGVGSLEVVFSLLFAAVFGQVLAGSSMILYRLSTYYIPFLISLVIMIFVGKDVKHTGIRPDIIEPNKKTS